jgi:uncharacterized protein (TIGR00730 family)
MSENPAICVFCGSSAGSNPEFAAAARDVGGLLARRGVDLVYGGGRVGLMGIVADSALEAGGRVIGVIPEALATGEIAHDALTEQHVVTGMHERKALMATRSSAFLTLPGGIGTFEELFEILTWGALGIHRKPIGILNVQGYFDPLFGLLEHGINAQLIRRESLQLLRSSDQPGPLIADLLAYQPSPSGPGSIKLDES